MNKITKVILKSISYLIIVTVIIFTVLMVGVQFFGIKTYTVLSGSMEPEYPVGSLIYVTEKDTNELKKGDVITFKMTEKVTATHRIVEIIEEENSKKFRTKGDANDFIDEKYVESKQIIGTPIFSIPYLGYVASFIQMPSGRNFACLVFTLLIMVVIVIDSITDDKKNKK